MRGVSEDYALKSWNLHAWYITGILSFLLIMSISLQWDHIPDLPGVISFALGLSSFLLAVIAIFQSLSGTSDITAGLSSIRSAADHISEVANKITGVGIQVADSSEKLLKQIQTPSTSKNVINENLADDAKHPKLLPGFLSFGGTIAVYACCLSAETGKSFAMADIYGEEDDGAAATYGDGAVRTLIDYELVEGVALDQRTKINSVKEDAKELLKTIKKRKFPKAAQSNFEEIMKKADTYFADPELTS